MQSSKLLKLIKETSAIIEGHFLLTSGRHSNVYIEKFRVLENPSALDEACKKMANLVKDKNIELVLGAAIGGILIAGGVGRHLGVKHIFSERVNGKMELRRGFSIKNKEKVLIVEDIITTGGSVLELIDLAKKHKAEIIHVVNLVQRSIDEVDFGVPTNTLLKIPVESWEAKRCPLCKKGLGIINPGRSGKNND